MYHVHHNSRWCIKLTVKSSLCLLYTPLSSSQFRHCSHSNIVFSASIQSSQKSIGCRRWAWERSCTAPRRCSTSSVLHLVPRDGQIALGGGPGHPHNWCLSLGQRNASDSWGGCQRETVIPINLSFIAICIQCVPTGTQMLYSYSTTSWHAQSDTTQLLVNW